MVKVTVEEERDPIRPYSVYKVPDFHQGAGFIRRRAPDKHCTLHPYNKKSIIMREAFTKSAKAYAKLNEVQKETWEEIEVTSFAQPRTSQEDHQIIGYKAHGSVSIKSSVAKLGSPDPPLQADIYYRDELGEPVEGLFLHIHCVPLDKHVYGKESYASGKLPHFALLSKYDLYFMYTHYPGPKFAVHGPWEESAYMMDWVEYWTAEEISKLETIYVVRI